MKKKNIAPKGTPDRRTVKLGQARRLTRASFDGRNSELVPIRLYDLGG